MKDFVKFIVVFLILALSVGLVYSILSPILGEFFPEETKDKNVSTETKEPTETKVPSTTITEPPETEVVDPEETESSHVHDYGNYVVVTEATCSNKGLEKATCKGCAGYITRETAKLAHAYDEGKITTEPTCAKAGVKTYTCSLCGNKKTETISKLTTHNYVDGFCSVCGYECDHDFVEGECSLCGATDPDYEEDQGGSDECNHSWEYPGGKNPATCNVCGEICTHPYPTYSDFYYVDSEYHDFDMTCSICGCSDTGSNVNGINYRHNFVEGECSLCGATDPDYEEDQGGSGEGGDEEHVHDFDSAGFCDCGDYNPDYDQSNGSCPEGGAHDYEEDGIDIDADGDGVDYQLYTCTKCGDTFGVPIE